MNVKIAKKIESCKQKRTKKYIIAITSTYPFLESVLLVNVPQQVGKMKNPQKSFLFMIGLKVTSKPSSYFLHFFERKREE